MGEGSRRWCTANTTATCFREVSDTGGYYPLRPSKCQFDVVTFAESVDGGFSFTQPPPPKNLVASLPNAYDPPGHPGPAGYQQPSNILKVGSYYYAMIFAWPYQAQKLGSCMLRTANPFDPGSWRAWDGSDYTIQFVNPYTEHGFVPAQHVCTPVLGAVFQSIVIDSTTGVYVANAFTGDNRFGPPGLYLSASSDLVHWSKPSLVITTADAVRDDSPGKWLYDYFALLDPKSSDRNFSTVSDRPFVYYMRLDTLRNSLTRNLMRRQLVLHTSR